MSKRRKMDHLKYKYNCMVKITTDLLITKLVMLEFSNILDTTFVITCTLLQNIAKVYENTSCFSNAWFRCVKFKVSCP